MVIRWYCVQWKGLNMAALWSGVSPLLFNAFTLKPASKSSCTVLIQGNPSNEVGSPHPLCPLAGSLLAAAMCNNVFPSSSRGFNAHSFCSIHDTLAFLLFPQSSSLVRNCKSWSIFPNNFVSSFPLSTVVFSFTNAVITWSSTSSTSVWLGRFLLSSNTAQKKYDKPSISMLTGWLQHCAIFIARVHSPT